MSRADSLNSPLISIDELDTAIVSCAARINAATYEWLLLVRQFDERAGKLRERTAGAGLFTLVLRCNSLFLDVSSGPISRSVR